MEIMKNLFDQSAVNAHSPMMLPTDFQQLRRELMRDWKQAALESLGAMPVDELEEARKPSASPTPISIGMPPLPRSMQTAPPHRGTQRWTVRNTPSTGMTPP